MGPDTILCATDLGPSGGRALDLAAQVARGTGGSVRLVHVGDMGSHVDLAGLDEHVRGAAETLRARVRARVDALSVRLEEERARCEASCEATLEEGRPWEAIIEAASRFGAQLVVVGPHDPVHAGRLRDRFLGTTAARVVRHAPCSVMVATGDAPASRLSKGPWVLGIDFSPASVDALREVSALARLHGVELVLVHVLPEAHVLGDVGNESERLRGAWASHARARLEALARAEAPSACIVSERVVGGPDRPVDGLCDAAEELGASLLVVGTHGRRAVGRALLGSTAERCLRRSRCPVLVARRPESGRA